MKNYLVKINIVETLTVDIEANNEKEAIQLVNEKFNKNEYVGLREWEIYTTFNDGEPIY